MPRQEQEHIRDEMVRHLIGDVLGPAAENEVLRQDRDAREGDTPLTRYLLGILYPSDSLVEPEEDDFANDGTTDEEDDAPDATAPITGMPKPSSIGISFAVATETTSLEIVFRYGLYTPSEQAGEETPSDGQRRRPVILWQRRQIVHSENVALAIGTPPSIELLGGARGELVVRGDDDGFVVSVFLRNANPTHVGPDEPERCIFQPEIIARTTDGQTSILNRAHRLHHASFDPDLESYRLLYRDKPEFAVGHGCAANWIVAPHTTTRAAEVRTDLVPTFPVTATEARGGGELTLIMEQLANIAESATMAATLQPLLTEYSTWIAARRAEIVSLPADLRSKAVEHMNDCDEALERMQRGLQLLSEGGLAFQAFRFANHAMHLQRRRSVEAANFQRGRGRLFDADPPAWRPFQIAFLLLNLEGCARPDSPERDIVDLLWFPTGGGKTEAYLGLAAFTMALRRLRHSQEPNPDACGDGGVTVVMRYTLRLLTIQQFQRAATLMCACETLRRAAPDRFGREVFSIGLWVGGGATPNWIDQDPNPQFGREPGALQALATFDPNNEPDEGNPVQLRACPWCGENLAHTDYRVISEALHLQIRCPNPQCEFHGNSSEPLSGIPAYLVDEDIYLRCPTLLIGTMDKIARLPWDDRTKALFGHVDRKCDRHGYLAQGHDYSGCGTSHRAKPGWPATGAPRAVPAFLPPQLIIQDELHLVTGPLGSLMGLYECAVDRLCSQGGCRPKIVASTATIRRYQDQIRGLFSRSSRQFPPPGLNAGDSFFAAENRDRPGRLFVGVCAPGRSVKTAVVRTLSSMMHTAERSRATNTPEDVDPYWTVVDYFNSLRELGGVIRLIDDDVDHRLRYLARIDGIPPRRPERRVELTSRIPAKEIPQRLRQMEQALASGHSIDVLLATNMISVGVDIQRFGLMLVSGQPKTSAEYIQASSRVGRQTPGLIFVLYNWSRPRDLSHFERFRTYHSMMYRHVEAASVTPFSARARDRALHGIFIGLIRLLDPQMAGNDGAANFDPNSPLVQEVMRFLIERIGDNDSEEREDTRAQLQALIDGWVEQRARHGPSLRYRAPGAVSATTPRTWLLQSAEEGFVGDFPRATLNSLRDVERTCGLYFKNFTRRGRQGGTS